MLFKRNRVNPNQVPFITLPSSVESNIIAEKQHNEKSSFKKGKHVEIFVKCRDIISVDLFSKTDPFIVFYVRRYGRWLEYGRTETIANTSRPTFTETICAEATNTDNNMLKASLFDGENMNSRDLQKCRHLGSVEFELSKLKSDSFTEFSIIQENGKSVGVLLLCGIAIENIIECKKEVQFSIGASRIAKKNFFNRADLYMEIGRELFQNTFHTVYRSEVICKTNTPHWKLFTVNAQRLYNNNKNTSLLFQIFGHNVKGEPELKGQVVLTLAKLIRYQGVVKEIPLRKFSSSKMTLTNLKGNHNNSSNAGYLKLYHVSFQEQYSLIDYVRSGVSIKAGIAIDFTLSNGYPLTSERSLHCLNHSQNEYIEAIKQMGSWISYYCNCVPMIGFGGKLHSKTFTTLNRNSICYIENGLKNLLTASNESDDDNNKDNNNCDINKNDEKYCFTISNNDSDMETLIESYKRVVCMIEPGGPTYFKKVLRNLLNINLSKEKLATTLIIPNEKTATIKYLEDITTHSQKTSKNKTTDIARASDEMTDFSIALIITDGVNNDEGDFEKFLFELSDQPIIIIVAGVGPCSFTSTQYLLNRVNRKVKRRMIFFYKVNDSIENKSDIKEIYAGISKAIVDFLIQKKVYPKQVESSNPLETIEHKTELNYRPSSPMFEPKSYCPTCGSYVDLSSQI